MLSGRALRRRTAGSLGMIMGVAVGVAIRIGLAASGLLACRAVRRVCVKVFVHCKSPDLHHL